MAQKLYKNPKKYSTSWNFGSEKNTVTSVLEVVKKIIKIWGSGKIIHKRNIKYYEQKNLQLNISKAKQRLKWKPYYSIYQSVLATTDWYKKVYIEKISKKNYNRSNH